MSAHLTRRDLIEKLTSEDVQAPSEENLRSQKPKEIGDALRHTLADADTIDLEVTHISGKAYEAFERLKDLQKVLDSMREEDDEGNQEDLSFCLQEARQKQIEYLRTRDEKNRALRLSLLEIFRGIREQRAGTAHIENLQQTLDQKRQDLEKFNKQLEQESGAFKMLSQNVQEKSERLKEKQDEITEIESRIASIQNDIAEKEQTINELQSQMVILNTATEHAIDGLVETLDVEESEKISLKQKLIDVAHDQLPYEEILKEINEQPGSVRLKVIQGLAAIAPAETFLKQVADTTKRKKMRHQTTLEAKKEKEQERIQKAAEKHDAQTQEQSLSSDIEELHRQIKTVTQEREHLAGNIEKTQSEKTETERGKQEMEHLRQEFDKQEEQLRALVGYDIEDELRVQLERIATDATPETAQENARKMLEILQTSHVWGNKKIIRFRPYLLEIAFATYEDDDDIIERISKELEESGTKVAVNAWSMDIEHAKKSILEQAKVGGRILAHCLHTRGQLCVLDIEDQNGKLCVSPDSLKNMNLDPTKAVPLETFDFKNFRRFWYEPPSEKSPDEQEGVSDR